MDEQTLIPAIEERLRKDNQSIKDLIETEFLCESLFRLSTSFDSRMKAIQFKKRNQEQILKNALPSIGK